MLASAPCSMLPRPTVWLGSETRLTLTAVLVALAAGCLALPTLSLAFCGRQNAGRLRGRAHAEVVGLLLLGALSRACLAHGGARDASPSRRAAREAQRRSQRVAALSVRAQSDNRAKGHGHMHGMALHRSDVVGVGPPAADSPPPIRLSRRLIAKAPPSRDEGHHRLSRLLRCRRVEQTVRRDVRIGRVSPMSSNDPHNLIVALARCMRQLSRGFTTHTIDSCEARRRAVQASAGGPVDPDRANAQRPRMTSRAAPYEQE